MIARMDRTQVERLVNMLEDLGADEKAALLYEVDAEYQFLKGVRDRVIQNIGRSLDEDGALEDVTEHWKIERTYQGSPRYEYNTELLERELKPLLRGEDWDALFKVVPEKREVKRIEAKKLEKRGNKVKEVLDAACTTIPPSRSVQVTPL